MDLLKQLMELIVNVKDISRDCDEIKQGLRDEQRRLQMAKRDLVACVAKFPWSGKVLTLSMRQLELLLKSEEEWDYKPAPTLTMKELTLKAKRLSADLEG